MEDISKRLRDAVNKLKLEGKLRRDGDLVEILGVGKSAVSMYLSGSQNPSKEFIKKFIDKFGIDLNGEAKTEVLPYFKQRQKLALEEKEFYFPVYAGNTQLRERYDITIYSDSAEQEIPIGFLPTSLFPGADHGEKAFGNSMYPRVVNQGLVIGKIVNKDRIVFGELYGIHYDGNPPIVKYVKKSRVPGFITVVSDNQHVEDQDIPYDEISLMFRVLYIINPA